jgi:hypothetical protein
VDRDGDLRPDELKRLGGAVGIHVARPEGRPPAGDRQQRDVDRAERVHLRKEVGVAGEVDPGAPFDDEAEAPARRPKRRPKASVSGEGGQDTDVAAVDRPMDAGRIAGASGFADRH